MAQYNILLQSVAQLLGVASPGDVPAGPVVGLRARQPRDVRRHPRRPQLPRQKALLLPQNRLAHARRHRSSVCGQPFRRQKQR